VALNCFQPQQSVSKMRRGRKRHQNSIKGMDESVPSQKGKEKWIATPTPCIGPRRKRPEEKEDMNLSDLFQKTPPQYTSQKKRIPEDKEGNYPYDPSQKDPESETAYKHAAAIVSPNAHHQDLEAFRTPLTVPGNPHLTLHNYHRNNIVMNQQINNHFLIVLHQHGLEIFIFMSISCCRSN
jgi:hypothetical protein